MAIEQAIRPAGSAPTREPGPAADETPPRVVRRGIVVTHGVGSQRRGEQLDEVVGPMVAFLGRALGHENVRLDVKAVRPGHKIAEATITIGPSNGPAVEEWYVREAWWAESFRPSDSGTIYAWALRAALFHFRATWKSVIQPNARALRDTTRQGVGVWRIPLSGRPYQVLNIVSWLFLMLAYFLFYAIGAVVLLPVVLFLQFPVRLFSSTFAGEAQRTLVDLVTGGVGDQHATTNRPVAVAAAADTVAVALYPFLASNARQRRPFDTVTLVAHSGGCVVSYEALAGADVKRWAQSGSCPRVTWVTVGSGLNLGWGLRASTKDRDVKFWDRRIDAYTNWIDIYSRYDPVPQGEAPAEFVRALVGEDAPPYASIRVANDDWPLTDHGAYWWNFEEVMPRIVHAITDSRLAWQTRDQIGSLLANRDHEKSDDSYAKRYSGHTVRGDHMLVEEVRQSLDTGGPLRRRRVARERFLSVAVCVALIGLTLGWPGVPLGGYRFWLDAPIVRLSQGLAGQYPDVAGWWRAAESLIPQEILGIGLGEFRPWLALVLTVLVAAFVARVLWRIGHSFLEWRRPEKDHEWPAVVAAFRPVATNAR